MLGTDLQIAARNVARHPRRSLLLGGAIATVMLLLVLVDGLAAGIRETLLRTATALVTGHVNVGGFYKFTSGVTGPLLVDYRAVLDEVTKHVPELDHATVRMRGFGKAVSETGSLEVMLGGVELPADRRFRESVPLVAGRIEELERTGTILVFEDQARRLGVGLGDVLTLVAPSARGVNNTCDVRVAAIGKSAGTISAWNAYVANATLLELNDLRPEHTGAIHLYLRDPADAAAVAARLRTALERAGWSVLEPETGPYWMKLLQMEDSQDWVGQMLDATTWEDELLFEGWSVTALDALTRLLVAVLMAIVAVGIMNAASVSVRERTREIGTLRAIGMQRRRVVWLFLLEAAFLGLAGAAAGALAGAGVAGLVNAVRFQLPAHVQMIVLSEEMRFSVHAGAVVRDMLAMVLATVLAAAYPAARAARLAPVDAMQRPV